MKPPVPPKAPVAVGEAQQHQPLAAGPRDGRLDRSSELFNLSLEIPILKFYKINLIFKL